MPSTVSRISQMMKFFLGLVCALLMGSAHAYSCVAKAGTLNWNTAGNWTSCNNNVPQDGDTVTIPSGSTITLNASSNNIIGLTINSGGILYASAGNDLYIRGTLTNNGTFDIRGSSGSNNDVRITGGNLLMTGSATSVWYFDRIRFNGNALTFNAGDSFTLNLMGDPIFRDTPNFNSAGTNTTITINLAQSGNQTISGANNVVYPNLQTSGSGTKYVDYGTLDIRGSVTIGSGTTFDVSNAAVNLRGNFTNNDTLTTAWNNFTFMGSSAQTLYGTTNFRQLLINNSNGVTLTRGNVTIGTSDSGGILTLTSGPLVTGSNFVIMPMPCNWSGQIVRTSGYVQGNLRLSYPNYDTTCTYPVGSGGNYAPITVTRPWYSGIAAGTLTGSTTSGEHPQILTSEINESKDVNRYWSLSASGDTLALGAGNYSATFQFVSGEVDSGATVTSFLVGRYVGGAWQPLAGSASGTTATITGLTGFGTFAVGERRPPHHIRLEHDGSGDTCGAETVTVKACADASCTTLYSSSINVSLTASGGTWASNPVSFTGSTTVSLTPTAAGTLTLGVSSATPSAANSPDCINTSNSSSSCTMTITACTASCASSLTGVVNTYYPGASSVAAGASSVTVGTPTGNSTTIRPGELVLIIQMQDATINSGNTSAYGANNATGSGATSLGNSGLYEYKVVSAISGSSITFTSALTNSYSAAAATATAGRKTFQVIRVPVLTSYTMTTVPTALAWNGSTGGVLAFDVSGTLSFSGNPTISVDGLGFTGGVGRSQSSGSGSNTDYRTNAGSNMANGAKGEGIAGTPSATDTTGAYGYPSGSNARGAPANAGGGATDGNPNNNDENTGGGGGAGYGSGGKGGNGWCGVFNASSPPNYGCASSGGIGGTGVAQTSARLTMGGGGGAGTSNNGTGTPGSGVASSGAAGGGLIFVRAGSLSGNATFSAKGANANNTVCNDGSGGGGGGGAVVVQVTSGNGLNNIAINASGGNGGTNLNPSICSGSRPHGPGGGGGGGYVVAAVVGSGSATPSSCSAAGGSWGDTYNNGTLFAGGYGSASGNAATCASSTGSAITTGASLGSGPSCTGTVNHYEVMVPASNVACLASTVTVKACADSSSPCTSAATNINGSTASLATNAGSLGSTSLTFNASGVATTTLSYPAAVDGASATLTLSGESAPASAARTCCVGASCSVANTCAATFNTTGFVFSASSGANVSIPNQIAGVGSGTYYLRAVKTNISTQACEAALISATSVDFAYECLNPATCYGGNLMTINGSGPGSSAVVSRNNSGSVSSYTSVNNLVFNANGEAPITFNYTDAGSIRLYARKSAGGTLLTPLSGVSNSFVVKPYGFKLDDLACSDTASKPSGAFCPAGETFTGTVKAVAYDGSAANHHLGTITPSFGRESSPQSVTWAIDSLVMPTAAGAVMGTLASTVGTFTGGSSNSAAGSFSWTEAGSLKLKPTIDYLGTGDMNLAGVGDSTAYVGTLGRFYPHHFALTASAVNAACGSFTYMDDPRLSITLTLAARNKSDGTTANYFNAATGGYVTPAAVTFVAENSNAGTDLGGRLSGLGAASWVAGQYQVNTTSAKFARNGTVPDGAYDSLQLGVRAVDQDGAVISGRDMNAAATGDCSAANTCDAKALALPATGIRIRYGRLRLANAFGSEQLPLPVFGQLEYYTVSGGVGTWHINSDDSCTALTPAATSLTLSGGTGAGTTTLTFASPAASGLLNLSLSKPTGGTGWVDIGFPGTPAYLQIPNMPNNTSARATFGIHNTNNNHIIYRRERY